MYQTEGFKLQELLLKLSPMNNLVNFMYMLQCRSKIGVCARTPVYLQAHQVTSVRASTLVYLQAHQLIVVRAFTPVHKQAAR